MFTQAQLKVHKPIKETCSAHELTQHFTVLHKIQTVSPDEALASPSTNSSNDVWENQANQP